MQSFPILSAWTELTMICPQSLGSEWSNMILATLTGITLSVW